MQRYEVKNNTTQELTCRDMRSKIIIHRVDMQRYEVNNNNTQELTCRDMRSKIILHKS